MNTVGQEIKVVDGLDIQNVVEYVKSESGPAVFRGLVSSWTLVQKSLESAEASANYLREHYEGAPVTAFFSEPGQSGRIFYSDDLAETNFEQRRTRLDFVLDELESHRAEPDGPVIYMGSMATAYCLPGLASSHSLPAGDRDVSTRIWIGNRTRVAAHYDALENIACVCAGRRRFTLFPPHQVKNLYVGPIDFTPAGQAISLVDFASPDFERYPRFADALEDAQTVELGPGDAIYIPAMWWHHVEGLEEFNILINHWWRNVPAFLGAPHDALLHAILNIRDLPDEQRQAWQELFDHYVFENNQDDFDHIPAKSRGILGRLDESQAKQLRALLRNNLNR